MWFKFSLSLLKSDVYFELSLNENGRHTKYDAIRQIAFINLLAACADGCEFSDAKSLADRFGVPIIQANRVWDVCLKFGVLTQADSGRYTAAMWMRARGLLGKDETKKTRANSLRSIERPDKETCAPPKGDQSSQKTDRSKDIAALFGGLNFKPNKKD